MSDLRNAIMSIVTKIASIDAIEADMYSDKMFKTVAIWNDQISRMEDGSGYSFLSPAAFVEVEMNDTEVLGWGITSNDMNVKIHILHTELDAEDGTLDQNLNVFDFRDGIKKNISQMRFTQGGNLLFVGETQDYEHTNLYHYIIEYRGKFIDTTYSTIPTQVSGTWSLSFSYSYVTGATGLS